MSEPWKYTPPAQERIDALELEVRQLTEQIAELRGGGAAKEYAELPKNRCIINTYMLSEDDARAFADATHALRIQQPASSAAPAGTYMTPEQVRDGIADWIDENILHREFWTPEVVDLVRSIEINPAAISPKPVPTPQADSQPAPVMEDTPQPCDQELFDQGVSVGLFDIPKWTAEALCRGIAAATEARVDWHYLGGRVHIKALPAARAPADSVLVRFPGKDEI